MGLSDLIKWPKFKDEDGRHQCSFQYWSGGEAMEDYPWILPTCKKIGPEKIFMAKDTNILRANLQAEFTTFPYVQFIFYGLFEVPRSSLKSSIGRLTFLTLDPYFTDHTIGTIACIS